MIQAEVVQSHFCVGSTHYPVGSLVTLPEPVVDRLIDEGKLKYHTGNGAGYARRDMQAESNPDVTERPKRRRRTKVEMEAARQADQPKGE